MDLLDELEQMVNVVEECGDDGQEPQGTEVERWQKLFGYTISEATVRLQAERADFNRVRVSDEHWALISEEKQQQGYDRAAYEHELGLYSRLLPPSTATAQS